MTNLEELLAALADVGFVLPSSTTQESLPDLLLVACKTRKAVEDRRRAKEKREEEDEDKIVPVAMQYSVQEDDEDTIVAEQLRHVARSAAMPQ